MVAPVSPVGRGRPGGGYRRVERPAAAEGAGHERSDERTASGRALVTLGEPAQRAEPPRFARFHADAGFLAQLIATAAGEPQTRARRRAEPEVSADAYGAAARSTFSLQPGRILSRTA